MLYIRASELISYLITKHVMTFTIIVIISLFIEHLLYTRHCVKFFT